MPLVLELQTPPQPGAVGADLTNGPPDVADERLRTLAIAVETERARIEENRSQAHSALPADMADERLRSLAITVETERARIDKNRSQASSVPLSDIVEGDTEEPFEGVAERAPASPAARLVGKNGMSWAISAEALSIGSDSTCDITAGAGSPDAEQVTARIWARGERVVLHALTPEPPVLVNGQRVTWALLEDGDALQVDGIMLRFEAYITGEGRAADVACQ